MTPSTIFITGAASGIGLETARLFSRKGWFVGITDIDGKGLAALAEEIGQDRCFAAVVDVTRPESVREAFDGFAGRTGGKLDVLFNNAGIARMGPFDEISLEAQLKIVDTNLKGVITVTYTALPLLKDTPGSRIISMASSSAVYGIPELAVYSATKHAICGLTEALDLELERYKIAVSDILAPYVRTPLVTGAERQAYSVRKTGVNLVPEQVAALVWKAAHRHKLHWRIHVLTHALVFLFWLFPFLRRPVVRYLALTPPGQTHEAKQGAGRTEGGDGILGG